MRALVPPLLIALGACAPTVPDSAFDTQVRTGAGVGFGDPAAYEAARLRREAELRGGALPPSGNVSSEPLGVTPVVEPSGGGAAAAAAGGLDPAVGAAVDRVSGTAPAPAAAPVPNSTGISDEQDFDAVAARESIESDAERLAQNRSTYVQVAPTAVPERPADTGANVVAFALRTTNEVGQSVHRRAGILAEARTERACARYRSGDVAQQAFLEAGGPERDRLGLDPDGDGFACGWDPRPFRAAAGR